MSRFVAGFALLYVCAVSGQHNAFIGRGRATSDKTSIAIDSIHGGNYPAGAFSIGYGGETIGGDGRPGGSYGVYTPNNQDYNGPGGIINEDFGHGHTGNNGYDQTGYRREPSNVNYPPPAQNQYPNNRPYDYNHYPQQNVYPHQNVYPPPVSNSASYPNNRLYNSMVRYLLSWF